MKINLGGVITEQADAVISINNSAFRNGDAVKEVLRFVNGEIIDFTQDKKDEILKCSLVV